MYNIRVRNTLNSVEIVVLIADTKVKIYRLLLLRVSGQAVPRSSIE